ncbi:protein kintoun [Neodiprion lecontei]|uniref:Protein kintoun n=1 Tax=Neodiprion lecontei TaxID=441921 RepID=A0A6J0BF75_NEOLC|nr:protein kintoun [Neodiprion lecontei]
MAVYNSRLKKNWEDLDVTKEELETITDCLKKEEFRKLLFDYAEEVTNPENKKLYQSEIAQLERERGVDVTFVNPEPGYVIKTSVDGSRKCFVNISQSSSVGKPSSRPSCEGGSRGLQWSIPHTLAPPRDDLDKKSARCVVFDVVFHPDTLHLASKNSKFRETVNQTALDGVESSFKVKLDRNNLKFPKMSFKGVSQPTVIRKKSERPPVPSDVDLEPEIYQKLMTSYDESREEQLRAMDKPAERRSPSTKYFNESRSTESECPAYTTPKFVVKHQDSVDIQDFHNHKNARLHKTIPKKLVVEIDLPLLKSAGDATLDVQERLVMLKSEKPAKYQLQLPLPYSVDPDNGGAKFDPKNKKLTVTLPVLRGVVPLCDNREDSGVDSDHGSPLADSGDDEGAEKKALVTVIDRESAFGECEEDTALRTSNKSVPDEPAFMKPDVKYSLPAFSCNCYDKTLAFTIHLKNVDPDSIRHKMLKENSGVHVLLTSVGAGFFPVYYSMCFKTGRESIRPESLVIEPWDNNVVITVALEDCREDVSKYFVGIDEEFMELRELFAPVSLQNKLNELMIQPCLQTNKKIEVMGEGDDIVINITPNQLDSDDEAEREDTDSSRYDDHRSISESSGDELGNIPGPAGRSKGILKSRRNYGFTRSVSESSVDDSAMLASSIDFHSDSIPEINSESGSSSLKKTVRFNDVVARQLYRSNSSILGQRKKNQRKLRNKKRAHDRRTSESENSESEERAEKYKISPKNTPVENSVHENVKPILNYDKSMVHKKSEHIDIENQKNHNSHSSKRNDESTEKNHWNDDNENGTNAVTEVFKNDLIFDLDI